MENQKVSVVKQNYFVLSRVVLQVKILLPEFGMV
ncbi:hypothetical protein SAMN05421785_105105 [Chryseobacterium gambrini]|uniref:Uncharacterized protein n=1 Tax=Chryseobacterium gambrini TaxID=373672 RepID=A0A1N7NUU6_9FLAO|nr:hypothetical protein CRDW_34370 [Chryseobacterium gambrini]SIT02046.1 hypothetical protein SAMN05421785_105105 [Chryseobacterium gambrini]